MVNGLGVAGWGVGGIEAEAAMLGQPLYQPMPIVVGFRLDDELPAGSTATDLVLTVTEMLRAHGVVGKFVEFHGPGLSRLSLADRATISNMSPEFGATATLFPIDDETLRYLRMTGRPRRARRRAWRPTRRRRASSAPMHSPSRASASRSASTWRRVVPSVAGPKPPQDRVALTDLRDVFRAAFPNGLHSHEDGTVHEHATTSTEPTAARSTRRAPSRSRPPTPRRTPATPGPSSTRPPSRRGTIRGCCRPGRTIGPSR